MSQPESHHVEEGELRVPTPELLSSARELLANVELVDVRPCEISAHVDQDFAPSTRVASVEVKLDLSFAAEEGIYGNRFDFRFDLKADQKQNAFGRIEFSLLLDYEVADGYTPEQEAAEYVMETTGYFAAYPYAREMFQSLAVRMQLDPIVLGLVRRGTLRPGTISIVPHSSVEA